VWPVDVNGDISINWQQNIGAFEGMADPNFPRLRPDANATRYGVDRRELFSVPENRMVWATIPYSRAPYHTVPYTNPPDFVGGGTLDIFAPRLLPAGPGNQYFVSGQDQAGDGGVVAGPPNPAIAAWL